MNWQKIPRASKTGIQRCALVVRTLSERDGVRCQGHSRPTKQRSIARSQPKACPTSSAIINCLEVPGLRSTRARNKLLNATISPTLYQKGRARVPWVVLVLTTRFSLYGTPVEMLWLLCHRILLSAVYFFATSLSLHTLNQC